MKGTVYTLQVKLSLTPFEELEPFTEIAQAYRSAVEYYGFVYGMTQRDLDALEGPPKTLSQRLLDTKTISYAGSPPGYAICPSGYIILFGYALHISDTKKPYNGYSMKACTAGREKCDGVGTKTGKRDDERIWAVCGREELPQSTQVVTQSTEVTTTAKCPESMVIGFGFGFSTGSGWTNGAYSDILACRRGQTICTKQQSNKGGNKTRKNYVWMMCFERGTPGLDRVRTAYKQNVGLKCESGRTIQMSTQCGQKEVMLSAFTMLITNRMHRNDVRSKFVTADAEAASCDVRTSGTCYGGNAFKPAHYEGLFGFAICGSLEKVSREWESRVEGVRQAARVTKMLGKGRR